MTSILAAVCGMLLVGGLLVFAAGIRRGPVEIRTRTSTGLFTAVEKKLRELGRADRIRLVAGLVAGALGYVLTGWLILVLIAPLAAWGLPALLSDPPNRDIGLLEALDRWIQLLLGSIPTGKSIPDAIRSTRHQCPPLLSEPVNRFVARIDVRWSTGDAFRAMAQDLDSPDADAVIAALILSGQRGGVGVTRALHGLSDSVSARLRALREVEAERAKPRVVVRQVTMISALVLGSGMLFSRSFFAPYGTPVGQLILAVLIGCYLGSLLMLRRMTIPPRRDRLLARVPAPTPREAVDA